MSETKELKVQTDEDLVEKCNHHAIKWNPFNLVVQCHICGEHWRSPNETMTVNVNEELKQQLDEELVEKVLTIGMDCEREEQEKWPNIIGVKDDAKAEITKLIDEYRGSLQSRQPVDEDTAHWVNLAHELGEKLRKLEDEQAQQPEKIKKKEAVFLKKTETE